MRRDFSFASILTGYRRIALGVGILVVAIVVVRILVFFGLLPPAVEAMLPGAGLASGLLLLAILAAPRAAMAGRRSLTISSRTSSCPAASRCVSW